MLPWYVLARWCHSCDSCCAGVQSSREGLMVAECQSVSMCVYEVVPSCAVRGVVIIGAGYDFRTAALSVGILGLARRDS